MRLHACVMRGGELHRISEGWVYTVSTRLALQVARETYTRLFYMESADYLAWYETGALTDTDHQQDLLIAGQLGEGMRLLHTVFPLAVEKGRRQAEARR